MFRNIEIISRKKNEKQKQIEWKFFQYKQKKKHWKAAECFE